MDTSPKSEGELWGALGFPQSCLSYYYRKEVTPQNRVICYAPAVGGLEEQDRAPAAPSATGTARVWLQV